MERADHRGRRHVVGAGRGDGDSIALSLGLVDGDVLRVWASSTTPAGSELPIIHLDLWKITVDITGIKLGVSLQELLKDSPDPGRRDPGARDIVIREKPGEGSGAGRRGPGHDGGRAPVRGRARSTSGWDRGKPTGNLVMPHGAAAAPVAVRARGPRDGSRLRARRHVLLHLRGHPREERPVRGRDLVHAAAGQARPATPTRRTSSSAASGSQFEVKDVVEITAQGMYRDELLPGRHPDQGAGPRRRHRHPRRRQRVGPDRRRLSGARGSRPAGEPHDYLLFLVALFGAIPMGPLELRGIEALYATGLMPKIEHGDREAGELKYYTWLKRARPTALPETRGARPRGSRRRTPGRSGSGVGRLDHRRRVGVPAQGVRRRLRLARRRPGSSSSSSSGCSSSKKPLALGVFEYDFKRDAFVLMIQLDITLKDIDRQLPRRPQRQARRHDHDRQQAGPHRARPPRRPGIVDRRQARARAQRSSSSSSSAPGSASSGRRTSTSAAASPSASP